MEGPAVADTSSDILELLLEDHRDFRELLRELEDAPPDQREDLFRYVVSRLASHEAAEEAVVHRAVRDDVPGGEKVAAARLSEEQEAEQLLARMAEMDPELSEFTDAVAGLRGDVLQHAENEERDEFPKLREHVDEGRRQKLGQAFQKLRDSGPTRPHPNTPQTPEVRAAAGPIVGMFDRARDAARNAFTD